MKVAVKIYIDGLRDQTHHADGHYDSLAPALAAAGNAFNEPGTSEVSLVKLNDRYQPHTPIVGGEPLPGVMPQPNTSEGRE